MGRDEMATWVRSEAKKRGWSFVELARRASVSIGSVYAIVERQRDAGFQLCAKIAYAFTVPRERALRAAGLLPPIILGGKDDEMKQELDEYWMYLSSDDRDIVRVLAQTLYEKRAERCVEAGAGEAAEIRQGIP